MTDFPDLSLAAWQPTRDLLHAYAGVSGAVRMALTPPQRHYGHASLFISARGVTTSPIPAGARTFEMILDLTQHQLLIQTSDGQAAHFPLRGQPAAQLGRDVAAYLAGFGVHFEPDAAELGQAEGVYDPAAVVRFHRALAQLDILFKQFSGELRRGAGTVRLWPHHFDLAVMWLTGRLVAGQDPDNEDYADERMNFGFSTGDATIPAPYLYATAYPLPPEMAHAELPAAARWQTEGWQGAVLPYADLVGANDAAERVLAFLRGVQDLGERYMTLQGYD